MYWFGVTKEEAIERAGSGPNFQHLGWDRPHDEPTWGVEPPLPFFEQVNPEFAPAIFSTENGTKPFKFIENFVMQREMDWWPAAKIQDVADQYRRDFYQDVKNIQQPCLYDDLYEYWDAKDIYTMGSYNLWNLLHHMHLETVCENQELVGIAAPGIEKIVNKALVDPAKRVILLSFNPEIHRDILDVFNDVQLPELGCLDAVYHNTLRQILLTNYMQLRRGGPVGPKFRVFRHVPQGYGSQTTGEPSYHYTLPPIQDRS